MSKKKKNRKLSSEVKTCFIAAVVLLVSGIGCIIYGKLFYSSDKMVKESDILTGQVATIISVEEQEVDLNYVGFSDDDDEDEEEYVETGDEESDTATVFHVVYSVTVNGTEYTYEDDLSEKRNPQVGDTDIINCAIVNGKLIAHPETQSTNSTVIIGWAIAILGVIAGGAGLFLKK